MASSSPLLSNNVRESKIVLSNDVCQFEKLTRGCPYCYGWIFIFLSSIDGTCQISESSLPVVALVRRCRRWFRCRCRNAFDVDASKRLDSCSRRLGESVIVFNGVPLMTGTSTWRTSPYVKNGRRCRRVSSMSGTVVLPSRPMPLRRNDSYWLVRVRGRWYCGLSEYREVRTSLNW